MKRSGTGSKSHEELRRCRPLLGTYVEISLRGRSEDPLLAGIEQAFTKIKQISSSLSFHDSKSELSRLNHAPVGGWIEASPELEGVLAMALRFQSASSGIFNVAVADVLVQNGFLPATNRSVSALRRGPAHASAFELKPGHARRTRAAQIDLGGIAKGYAVDQAVRCLRELLPEHVSGCVNAGGDLRCFGRRAQRVRIRQDFGDRLETRRELVFRNRALATSSVIPSERNGLRISPYVQTKKNRLLSRPKTAVILADDCMVADAMTKIALLVPRARATRIAKDFGAQIWVSR
jgi:thiamine biosynthesis lipoprotein